MPRKKAPVPTPAHVKPHDKIIRSLKVSPSAAQRRRLAREKASDKVKA